MGYGQDWLGTWMRRHARESWSVVSGKELRYRGDKNKGVSGLICPKGLYNRI